MEFNTRKFAAVAATALAFIQFSGHANAAALDLTGDTFDVGVADIQSGNLLIGYQGDQTQGSGFNLSVFPGYYNPSEYLNASISINSDSITATRISGTANLGLSLFYVFTDLTQKLTITSIGTTFSDSAAFFSNTSGYVPSYFDFSSNTLFFEIGDIILGRGGSATFTLDGYGTPIGGATGASGVPEPATWAMMLVGFGLAGYTMRKRPGLRTQGVKFRFS